MSACRGHRQRVLAGPLYRPACEWRSPRGGHAHPLHPIVAPRSPGLGPGLRLRRLSPGGRAGWSPTAGRPAGPGQLCAHQEVPEGTLGLRLLVQLWELWPRGTGHGVSCSPCRPRPWCPRANSRVPHAPRSFHDSPLPEAHAGGAPGDVSQKDQEAAGKKTHEDGVGTCHPLDKRLRSRHPGSSAERPAPALHWVGGWGPSADWYDLSPRKRTSVFTSTSVAPRGGRAPSYHRLFVRWGSSFQPLFICVIFLT